MALLSVTNIFNSLRSRSKPIPNVPDKVWQDPLYFFAFGLGSGAIPIAPGTFGTLFAIPFYLLIAPLSLYAYLTIVFCFIVASMVISEKVSRDTHTHDHPGMCIDEFAGFFVTMIHAPIGWPWVLAGFLLFRLFDIWKPWPIKLIDENVKGGFGMVLDDIVAGMFAMILIQLFSRFFT